MVRIHSPRPIPSITCRDWTTKQPTQLPTQFQSCCRIRSLLYCGHGEEVRERTPSNADETVLSSWLIAVLIGAFEDVNHSIGIGKR